MDEDVVRNDFLLMKKAGLKVVRVFPNWRDFQPIEIRYGGCATMKEIRLHGKALSTSSFLAVWP